MEEENLTSSVNDIDYDEDDVDFDSDEIFKLVSVIILSVLGIVGNAIIIFAYAKKKRRTSTDVLIIAQAATDFIATALAPSLILKTAFSSLVTDGVCVVSEIAENGSAFMSLFIMTAISVDRYLAVCRPFQRRMSNRHALIITLSCLIISIAIMSPRAIFIKSIDIDVEVEVNCEIHHGRQMRLFVTALFPVTFAGALMITSVLYTRIYIFLRRQAKVHASLVNANSMTGGTRAGAEVRNDTTTATTSERDQRTASSPLPNTYDHGDEDLLSGGAEATATLTKMKPIPSVEKPNDAEDNMHRLHTGSNHGEEVKTLNVGTANAPGSASTTEAANSESQSQSTTLKVTWDDGNAYQAPSRESKLVTTGSNRSTNRPPSQTPKQLTSMNEIRDVASTSSRGGQMTNADVKQNAVSDADRRSPGQPTLDAVTAENTAPATASRAVGRPEGKKENDMGRTTTKILLFITLFFFLTWIPQIVLTLFFQNNVDLLTSNSLALVIGGFSVLRSSNHVVNIFVYYYANRPFRNTVNHMFRNPCSFKTKIW